MDEIQKLLRVAAKRNAAGDYTDVKFRILRSLVDRFRRQAMEDRVSGNVIIEAVLRGYVEKHPAVLAMLDKWISEEQPEQREVPRPRMSKKDLAEIYAAAGSGMIEEDNNSE